MASLLLGPVKRYLTELLVSQLSRYLEGVVLEGIGFLGSDLVLNNVELRVSAFNELLPAGAALRLRRGFAKELRVHIPWTALFSAPIEVRLETIECILSPVDVHDVAGGSPLSASRSPKPSPAPATASPAAAAAGGSGSSSIPEWLQSRISRILGNATLRVNNLILKLVHGDAVLMASLRSLTVASADPANDWAPAIVSDAGGPFQYLHKSLTVLDLTVTCDGRGVAGGGGHSDAGAAGTGAPGGGTAADWRAASRSRGASTASDLSLGAPPPPLAAGDVPAASSSDAGGVGLATSAATGGTPLEQGGGGGQRTHYYSFLEEPLLSRSNIYARVRIPLDPQAAVPSAAGATAIPAVMSPSGGLSARLSRRPSFTDDASNAAPDGPEGAAFAAFSRGLGAFDATATRFTDPFRSRTLEVFPGDLSLQVVSSSRARGGGDGLDSGEPGFRYGGGAQGPHSTSSSAAAPPSPFAPGLAGGGGTVTSVSTDLPVTCVHLFVDAIDVGISARQVGLLTGLANSLHARLESLEVAAAAVAIGSTPSSAPPTSVSRSLSLAAVSESGEADGNGEEEDEEHPEGAPVSAAGPPEEPSSGGLLGWLWGSVAGATPSDVEDDAAPSSGGTRPSAASPSDDSELPPVLAEAFVVNVMIASTSCVLRRHDAALPSRHRARSSPFLARSTSVDSPAGDASPPDTLHSHDARRPADGAVGSATTPGFLRVPVARLGYVQVPTSGADDGDDGSAALVGETSSVASAAPTARSTRKKISLAPVPFARLHMGASTAHARLTRPQRAAAAAGLAAGGSSKTASGTLNMHAPAASSFEPFVSCMEVYVECGRVTLQRWGASRDEQHAAHITALKAAIRSMVAPNSFSSAALLPLQKRASLDPFAQPSQQTVSMQTLQASRTVASGSATIRLAVATVSQSLTAGPLSPSALSASHGGTLGACLCDEHDAIDEGQLLASIGSPAEFHQLLDDTDLAANPYVRASLFREADALVLQEDLHSEAPSPTGGARGTSSRLHVPDPSVRAALCMVLPVTSSSQLSIPLAALALCDASVLKARVLVATLSLDAPLTPEMLHDCLGFLPAQQLGRTHHPISELTASPSPARSHLHSDAVANTPPAPTSQPRPDVPTEAAIARVFIGGGVAPTVDVSLLIGGFRARFAPPSNASRLRAASSSLDSLTQQTLHSLQVTGLCGRLCVGSPRSDKALLVAGYCGGVVADVTRLLLRPGRAPPTGTVNHQSGASFFSASVSSVSLAALDMSLHDAVVSIRPLVRLTDAAVVVSSQLPTFGATLHVDHASVCMSPRAAGALARTASGFVHAATGSSIPSALLDLSHSGACASTFTATGVAADIASQLGPSDPGHAKIRRVTAGMTLASLRLLDGLASSQELDGWSASLTAANTSELQPGAESDASTIFDWCSQETQPSSCVLFRMSASDLPALAAFPALSWVGPALLRELADDPPRLADESDAAPPPRATLEFASSACLVDASSLPAVVTALQLLVDSAQAAFPPAQSARPSSPQSVQPSLVSGAIDVYPPFDSAAVAWMPLLPLLPVLQASISVAPWTVIVCRTAESPMTMQLPAISLKTMPRPVMRGHESEGLRLQLAVTDATMHTGLRTAPLALSLAVHGSAFLAVPPAAADGGPLLLQAGLVVSSLEVAADVSALRFVEEVSALAGQLSLGPSAVATLDASVVSATQTAPPPFKLASFSLDLRKVHSTLTDAGPGGSGLMLALDAADALAMLTNAGDDAQAVLTLERMRVDWDLNHFATSLLSTLADDTATLSSSSLPAATARPLLSLQPLGDGVAWLKLSAVLGSQPTSVVAAVGASALHVDVALLAAVSGIASRVLPKLQQLAHAGSIVRLSSSSSCAPSPLDTSGAFGPEMAIVAAPLVDLATGSLSITAHGFSDSALQLASAGLQLQSSEDDIDISSPGSARSLHAQLTDIGVSLLHLGAADEAGRQLLQPLSLTVGFGMQLLDTPSHTASRRVHCKTVLRIGPASIEIDSADIERLHALVAAVSTATAGFLPSHALPLPSPHTASELPARLHLSWLPSLSRVYARHDVDIIVGAARVAVAVELPGAESGRLTMDVGALSGSTRLSLLRNVHRSACVSPSGPLLRASAPALMEVASDATEDGIGHGAGRIGLASYILDAEGWASVDAASLVFSTSTRCASGEAQRGAQEPTTRAAVHVESASKHAHNRCRELHSAARTPDASTTAVVLLYLSTQRGCGDDSLAHGEGEHTWFSGLDLGDTPAPFPVALSRPLHFEAQVGALTVLTHAQLIWRGAQLLSRLGIGSRVGEDVSSATPARLQLLQSPILAQLASPLAAALMLCARPFASHSDTPVGYVDLGLQTTMGIEATVQGASLCLSVDRIPTSSAGRGLRSSTEASPSQVDALTLGIESVALCGNYQQHHGAIMCEGTPQPPYLGNSEVLGLRASLKVTGMDVWLQPHDYSAAASSLVQRVSLFERPIGLRVGAFGRLLQVHSGGSAPGESTMHSSVSVSSAFSALLPRAAVAAVVDDCSVTLSPGIVARALDFLSAFHVSDPSDGTSTPQLYPPRSHHVYPGHGGHANVILPPLVSRPPAHADSSQPALVHNLPLSRLRRLLLSDGEYQRALALISPQYLLPDEARELHALTESNAAASSAATPCLAPGDLLISETAEWLPRVSLGASDESAVSDSATRAVYASTPWGHYLADSPELAATSSSLPACSPFSWWVPITWQLGLPGSVVNVTACGPAIVPADFFAPQLPGSAAASKACEVDSPGVPNSVACVLEACTTGAVDALSTAALHASWQPVCSFDVALELQGSDSAPHARVSSGSTADNRSHLRNLRWCAVDGAGLLPAAHTWRLRWADPGLRSPSSQLSDDGPASSLVAATSELYALVSSTLASVLNVSFVAFGASLHAPLTPPVALFPVLVASAAVGRVRATLRDSKGRVFAAASMSCGGRSLLFAPQPLAHAAPATEQPAATHAARRKLRELAASAWTAASQSLLSDTCVTVASAGMDVVDASTQLCCSLLSVEGTRLRYAVTARGHVSWPPFEEDACAPSVTASPVVCWQSTASASARIDSIQVQLSPRYVLAALASAASFAHPCVSPLLPQPPLSLGTFTAAYVVVNATGRGVLLRQAGVDTEAPALSLASSGLGSIAEYVWQQPIVGLGSARALAIALEDGCSLLEVGAPDRWCEPLPVDSEGVAWQHARRQWRRLPVTGSNKSGTRTSASSLFFPLLVEVFPPFQRVDDASLQPSLPASAAGTIVLHAPLRIVNRTGLSLACALSLAEPLRVDGPPHVSAPQPLHGRWQHQWFSPAAHSLGDDGTGSSCESVSCAPLGEDSLRLQLAVAASGAAEARGTASIAYSLDVVLAMPALAPLRPASESHLPEPPACSSHVVELQAAASDDAAGGVHAVRVSMTTRRTLLNPHLRCVTLELTPAVRVRNWCGLALHLNLPGARTPGATLHARTGASGSLPPPCVELSDLRTMLHLSAIEADEMPDLDGLHTKARLLDAAADGQLPSSSPTVAGSASAPPAVVAAASALVLAAMRPLAAALGSTTGGLGPLPMTVACGAMSVAPHSLPPGGQLAELHPRGHLSALLTPDALAVGSFVHTVDASVSALPALRVVNECSTPLIVRPSGGGDAHELCVARSHGASAAPLPVAALQFMPSPDAGGAAVVTAAFRLAVPREACHGASTTACESVMWVDVSIPISPSDLGDNCSSAMYAEIPWPDRSSDDALSSWALPVLLRLAPEEVEEAAPVVRGGTIGPTPAGASPRSAVAALTLRVRPLATVVNAWQQPLEVQPLLLAPEVPVTGTSVSGSRVCSTGGPVQRLPLGGSCDALVPAHVWGGHSVGGVALYLPDVALPLLVREPATGGVALACVRAARPRLTRSWHAAAMWDEAATPSPTEPRTPGAPADAATAAAASMRALEHALGALVGLGATVPAGHATRLAFTAASDSTSEPHSTPPAALTRLLRLDVAMKMSAASFSGPDSTASRTWGAHSTTATISCDPHPPLRLVNDAPWPVAVRLRRVPVLPPHFSAWVNEQLQPLGPLVAALQAALGATVQAALPRVDVTGEREALELRCARAKLALAMAMEARLSGSHGGRDGGVGGSGSDTTPEPLVRHPLLCCSYVHSPSMAVVVPAQSVRDWDWSCLAEWRQYLPQSSLRVQLLAGQHATARRLDVPLVQVTPAFPAAWSAVTSSQAASGANAPGVHTADGGTTVLGGRLGRGPSFTSAALTPSELACEPPAVRHLHQLAQVAVLPLSPTPVLLEALSWSEPAWLFPGLVSLRSGNQAVTVACAWQGSATLAVRMSAAPTSRRREPFVSLRQASLSIGRMQAVWFDGPPVPPPSGVTAASAVTLPHSLLASVGDVHVLCRQLRADDRLAVRDVRLVATVGEVELHVARTPSSDAHQLLRLPIRRGQTREVVSVCVQLAVFAGASGPSFSAAARLLLLDVSLPEAAVAVTDSALLFMRARAEPFLTALARCAASLPPLAASAANATALAVPREQLVALDRLRLRAQTLLVSLRWAGPPLPVCISFSGVPVTLSAVDLVKPLLGLAQLRKELLASVVADALMRAPAVLGSSELLGNPTAAVRTISDALVTALDAPFAELAHMRASRSGGWLHNALFPLAAVGAMSRGVFSGFVTVGARAAYAATSSFGSLARSLGETMTSSGGLDGTCGLTRAVALADRREFVDVDDALDAGLSRGEAATLRGASRPGVARSLLLPVGAALRIVGEMSSTLASTIRDDDEGMCMTSSRQLVLVLRRRDPSH